MTKYFKVKMNILMEFIYELKYQLQALYESTFKIKCILLLMWEYIYHFVLKSVYLSKPPSNFQMISCIPLTNIHQL